MASATFIQQATNSFKYLNIEKDIDQSSKPVPETVAYWATLIRTNLEIARGLPMIAEQSIPLIDEEILNAPRRKSPRDALASEVAVRLYPASHPDSLAPIIQYEKDVVILRSLISQQRRHAVDRATERNASHDWTKRILKQGPWDEKADPLPLTGAPALPMPVEVSNKESLAPFFTHLSNGGTHEPASVTKAGNAGKPGLEPYHNTELLEFDKGVLYSDGRVDLCKMVTGPTSIGDLMRSLESNEFSKHFLLGNNIIGPIGAKAIAEYITKYPERFETWYLAGNCIDASGFALLVNAMTASEAITNVWLKRNPLGPTAAKDLFRLIVETPNLRTLDLDQTEIGDTGVAELFSLLAENNRPIPLRHLYLNAVGIGETACQQISRYVGTSHCSLESIYMSNNPIGSAVATLAEGFKNNSSLVRISMQSCGLQHIDIMLGALCNHHRLEMLDIGQSYATEDLGMRYNWIMDDSVLALVNLIESSKTLKYLNLAYTPITQESLNKVLDAVRNSTSLVWFQAKPLVTGGQDVASVKAGQEGARLSKLMRDRLHENVRAQYCMDYSRFEAEAKRFLVSPRDVRFIDSVYRNRDAAAARRGLKRLEKWWDESDETLQQVKDGTLV